MHLDCRLIRHGSRRKKQGSLMPEHVRHTLLQRIHRRILRKDIIPSRGFKHGRPHLRGRSGDSIRSQIDGGRKVVTHAGKVILRQN